MNKPRHIVTERYDDWKRRDNERAWLMLKIFFWFTFITSPIVAIGFLIEKEYNMVFQSLVAFLICLAIWKFLIKKPKTLNIKKFEQNRNFNPYKKRKKGKRYRRR